MQPGFLSLGIHDSCLASLAPVAAHVRVSDMHEVEVDLSEKVIQPRGSPTVLLKPSIMGCIAHQEEAVLQDQA